MNSINISHDVAKFIKKLPHKVAAQLSARIFDLCRSTDHQDIKHINGKPGYFRIDQGEYRIIFRRENQIIYIPVVGKRNDDEVYKTFDRKS